MSIAFCPDAILIYAALSLYPAGAWRPGLATGVLIAGSLNIRIRLYIIFSVAIYRDGARKMGSKRVYCLSIMT